MDHYRERMQMMQEDFLALETKKQDMKDMMKSLQTKLRRYQERFDKYEKSKDAGLQVPENKHFSDDSEYFKNAKKTFTNNPVIMRNLKFETGVSINSVDVDLKREKIQAFEDQIKE